MREPHSRTSVARERVRFARCGAFDDPRLRDELRRSRQALRVQPHNQGTPLIKRKVHDHA